MGEARAKIFDDITQLASGAAGVAQAMRTEIEQLIRARMDALIADGGLVTREEFEVVRDMAAQARHENDALRAEIEKLKSS